MAEGAMADPPLMHMTLDRADDFNAWREIARRLAGANVAPEQLLWSVSGEGADDLFAASAAACPPLSSTASQLRAGKGFIELAGLAILHSDPGRFALLYRLLLRMQREAHLMDNAADSDMALLHQLVRQTRRDIHKMRAFVRFRCVTDGDGCERYVAWFEPDHHIVRHNADFFINRFASQRWSILTPRLSLHWADGALREGPGARREDAPADDAAEQLWQRYYAAIFNPARLKVAAMVKEMPRRYWKNLPEARLIPQLVAGAQAREAAMVDQGASLFTEGPPATLADVAQGLEQCRRCAIGCNGTRAVAGQGAPAARMMIVGEQPGDMEEQTGQPFVGPAGQLLDLHLEQAGVDRTRSWVTNAVKHFKYSQRGKRRLHQNPTAGEIDTCRWWLDAERALVRPKVILTLGASAGRAILGRTPSIGRERGRPVPLADGTLLWMTVHPSYLLRLDDAARPAEEERFRADLHGLAQLLHDAGDGKVG